MITAQQVADAQFDEAQHTAGFDVVAVDDFLDQVIETLSRLERGEALSADDLTSHQVVDTEFPEVHTMPGGYDMDQVDDLLDLVAQRLYAHEQGLTSAPAAAEASASPEPLATPSQPVNATSHPVNAVAEPDPAATGTSPAVVEASETSEVGVCDDEARADQYRDPAEEGPVAAREEAGVHTPQAEPVVDVRPVDVAQEVEAPATAVGAGGALGSAWEANTAESEFHPVQPVSEPVASRSRVEPVQPVQPVQPVDADEPAHGVGRESEFQAPEIISYPARDHRVPLPRAGAEAKMSEADVEAGSNYHPEYSEYASGERNTDGEYVTRAQLRELRGDAESLATESSTTESSTTEPSGTEPSGMNARVTEAGSDERRVNYADSTTLTAKDLPEAPNVSAGSDTQVASAVSSDAPVSGSTAGLPLRDTATGELRETASRANERSGRESGGEPDALNEAAEPGQVSEVAELRHETAATASPQSPSATETLAPETYGTATFGDERSVERPAPIDKPDSIETPKALPERNDTSAKGFLRRLFKG